MNSKIGIFTWFGFILPIDEKLRLIKEAGFDSVIGWYGNEFSELDGDYSHLCERVEKHGLYVENSHIPYFGCDNIWFDSLSGEELFKKYIADIKNAPGIGITTLVFHPFEKKAPEGGNQSLMLKRFEAMCETAEKCGVRLAIENLCDDIALKLLLDKLKSFKSAGLCFDTGHNNIANGNFSLLDRYQSRLFALHIHDNDAIVDKHILPTEGTINWQEFTSALEKTSYTGSLTLESSYPDYYDEQMNFGCITKEKLTPDEYLFRAAQKLRLATTCKDTTNSQI